MQSPCHTAAFDLLSFRITGHWTKSLRNSLELTELGMLRGTVVALVCLWLFGSFRVLLGAIPRLLGGQGPYHA